MTDIIVCRGDTKEVKNINPTKLMKDVYGSYYYTPQNEVMREICDTDSMWAARFPMTTASQNLSDQHLYFTAYTHGIFQFQPSKRKKAAAMISALMFEKCRVVKDFWKEICKITYTQVKSCQTIFTMQERFDLQKCGI